MAPRHVRDGRGQARLQRLSGNRFNDPKGTNGEPHLRLHRARRVRHRRWFRHGPGTARAFADTGAAVTLADVNDDQLQAAKRELQDSGHRVLAVQYDVAGEDQVAAAVATPVQAFGSLDLAYNNAGIQAPTSDAADETAEVFDRVNGVNLRASVPA
jgi:Enoyl-(Acyl carrier protein) reductase